jgi:arylsulfatase A-like enzyme
MSPSPSFHADIVGQSGQVSKESPARNLLRGLIAFAVWSGLLFGVLEGVVLCVTHSYPAVRAAHKTSTDVLWMAPLLDIVAFLLAAGLLALVVHRRHVSSEWLVRTSGLGMVFIGSATVLGTASVLHPVAVVLMSAGIVAAVSRRKTGDSPSAFARRLSSRMWLVPLIIGALIIGVRLARHVQELRAVGPAPAGQHGPNVLIVVLDTFRRDRFERVPSITPTLDRLARESVRYTDAWATSSWSLPSHASILTGLYPHQHLADWPTFRESTAVATLPEYLASRGYVTGAFSGNAAWVTPEYLGRGFQRFQVYTPEDLLQRTMIGRVVDRPLWEVGFHPAGRGKSAATVTEEFVDFIDDYPARPFFAYLCYMDANQSLHAERYKHGTRQQAPPSDVARAYDAGVRRLDGELASLDDALRARGLLEHTVLIVTADHGESFAPGEAGDHPPLGHGTSLYPEQLRVPLFVRLPGGSAPRTITESVSIKSVPALVMDALGIKHSPFEPASSDASATTARESGDLLATLRYAGKGIESVVWDRWQYIDERSKPESDEELFDRQLDPTAEVNLGPLRPDLIKQGRILRKQLLR